MPKANIAAVVAGSSSSASLNGIATLPCYGLWTLVDYLTTNVTSKVSLRPTPRPQLSSLSKGS